MRNVKIQPKKTNSYTEKTKKALENTGIKYNLPIKDAIGAATKRAKSYDQSKPHPEFKFGDGGSYITTKGGQPSDSTAWKNRTLPNLTEQGLDYEIGRLSKMVTPKSAPSIIQQKIDMLKREKIRRTTVKKVTTNKKK